MYNIITIDFIGNDDLVETDHNNYDKDSSLSEPILDDNLSETGTENSVLDYEGNVKATPLKKMLLVAFKECRGIFAQPTNQGTYMCLCGNSRRYL